MTSASALRQRLTRFRQWALRFELRVAPTESQRLFGLTLLIGVACGLAAVAFHFSIAFAESLLFERAIVAHGRWWLVAGVLTPALGGLVAGLLLKHVVPNARGSGVPQVKVAYASKEGTLRLRDAVGKLFVASLQIGSGASLGREGPTVQICSGLASALGRFGRLSPRNRRRLLPVGAAAGVAAAFNAPIAAVTFTIEEVVGNLDQTVLSGVIVAAALAAVIERSILGTHPVFSVPQAFGLTDARSLLLYAALGLAAALLSVVFTDGLLRVRAKFRAQRRIPDWAQPAVGGLVTGAIAVAALYWLGTSGVNGGGYRVVESSLSGVLPVKVLLLLGVAKLVATIFSYSSGGAGGIFAPSLFMGAMLGGAFGSLDRSIFGHGPEAMGAFALVGMGATFCGTIRAPMTSVLIIVELTSGYGLILPLMIANMSAYALARYLRPVPIYEALLEQDGIHLKQRGSLQALDQLKLSALPVQGADRPRLWPAARGRELGLALPPGQHVLPVLNGEKLVGLVTSEELAILEQEPGLGPLITASDIMRPPASVDVDESLLAALDLMRAESLPELPVVNASGQLLGFIDEATIAQAYLHESDPKPQPVPSPAAPSAASNARTSR
ncbi:MAG: Cl-channel voltage-gated family protein [Polyangiaceae bacterium]|jgi:CIC family chloride channel protein|nr:Cl-channel voltage-gated family protein [Polyangiaceae bacterium]